MSKSANSDGCSRTTARFAAVWATARTVTQRSTFQPRRSAIVAAIPFALLGAWNSYLAFLALYAATSFFLVQHVRHRDSTQRD